MIFEDITNAKAETEKSELRSAKYSYRTPPQKQRLEEEVNKRLSELKSFENIKFDKSNCSKENCSCREIKKIFESLNKTGYVLSPSTLERNIENKCQNKVTVMNIINHINQNSKFNTSVDINNTSDKNNVVKNLLTELNKDILSTPVLGMKRSLSSSLFKSSDPNGSEIKNLNTTAKKRERNNYYIKEIKSKKYTNSRIKFNKNFLSKFY